MNIKIELRDRELRAALSRLVVAGEDFSPAMTAIEGHLRRISENAFEQEADPSTNEAWAPLSDVTKRLRRKAGKNDTRKLRVDGHLLDSIVADHDRTSAVVGTNLVYATTQHFGARKGEFGSYTNPITGQPHPIPWGDIPARPFFGFTAGDKLAISRMLQAHIEGALGRG